MIARAVLGFLIFFSMFFGIAWVVFRTNLVTRRVMKEVAKTGTILAISALLAAAAIGFLIAVSF